MKDCYLLLLRGVYAILYIQGRYRQYQGGMKRFLLFKRNSHTFHFVRIAACKSFLRPLVFVSRSEFHKDLDVNEFLKVM